jgi:hypothetical protein
MPRDSFCAHTRSIDSHQYNFGRNLLCRVLLVISCSVVCSWSAFAQTIQYASNTIDQTKRSQLTVDPSTRGITSSGETVKHDLSFIEDDFIP